MGKRLLFRGKESLIGPGLVFLKKGKQGLRTNGASLKARPISEDMVLLPYTCKRTQTLQAAVSTQLHTHSVTGVSAVIP
jgi:hypothetical protein